MGHTNFELNDTCIALNFGECKIIFAHLLLSRTKSCITNNRPRKMRLIIYCSDLSFPCNLICNINEPTNGLGVENPLQ